MLGKKDGANMTDGSSYLEIVSFLKANGVSPQKDLEELWENRQIALILLAIFYNYGKICT